MVVKDDSRISALNKMQENVNHTSRLRTNVTAGSATSAPSPLGPLIGQHNINVANFCTYLNDTKDIPMPIHSPPPATFFLIIIIAQKSERH